MCRMCCRVKHSTMQFVWSRQGRVTRRTDVALCHADIYMTISDSAAETDLCSIKLPLGSSRIAGRRSRSRIIAEISFRVTASGAESCPAHPDCRQLHLLLSIVGGRSQLEGGRLLMIDSASRQRCDMLFTTFQVPTSWNGSGGLRRH